MGEAGGGWVFFFFVLCDLLMLMFLFGVFLLLDAATYQRPSDIKEQRQMVSRNQPSKHFKQKQRIG